MGRFYFTCSFDDGDVADLRLAELLTKYSLKGTFYIPQTCDLVSKSLCETQIRELSASVEIGGHTISHQVLTRINNSAACKEIQDCKVWLQNVTGKEIYAFCPPTGRFKEHHVAIQKEAGFTSMRTVEMLSHELCNVQVEDGFVILPTSAQVYNHASTAYLKNSIKRLNFKSFPLFRNIFNARWELMSNNYVNRLREISETKCDENFFHLWGHSWELDRYSLWDSLEIFFKNISSLENIMPCTNSELAEAIRLRRHD